MKQATKGRTTTRADLLEAVFSACPTLSRAQARTRFAMGLGEIADSLDRNESVKPRGVDRPWSPAVADGVEGEAGLTRPAAPRAVDATPSEADLQAEE